MTQPVYATREAVKQAIDSKATAYNDSRVDDALDAASRAVEGLCHRRFYPETATRYFDWPNAQTAAPWRLWLDDSDLISLTSISSGGTTISTADVILEPNRTGPPYNRVEIDLSSSAAFGGGATHQQDITITGLWGHSNDESTAGLVDEAMTDTETAMDVTDSAAIGVGQVIRVGTERMLVTGKTMKDTLVNIDAADSLTASVSDVSITLSTTTGAPVVGETILIDSERMLVVDLAGTVATVRRAWDGSTLAAHAAGADIYAPRTLTVTRGALGTTAAAMALGDAVYRWDPPGTVRALTVAEASVILLQGAAGWARTAGTGDNQREVTGRGLAQLRAQVYATYGRKARSRAV